MPASPLPADAEPPAGPAKHGPASGRRKGAPPKPPAAMTGNDFAKAIGINKPANVRDKIKRWQVEVEVDNGAERGRGEDVAVEPTPASSVPTTPTPKLLDDKPAWKPAHTAPKSLDGSPERPASAIKTPATHNPLDDDLLTATAPKKRVISDSHWRQKQSPPKETGRPPPKTIPNAWVRPSKIIKNDRPALKDPKDPKDSKDPKDPKDLKAPAPNTPTLNPLLPLVSYVGKSTGQTKPSPKPRRPSKPSSADHESGSSTTKDAKPDENVATPKSPHAEGDPMEIVKVRRRRRARTSPRRSVSPVTAPLFAHTKANKSETALTEDSADVAANECDKGQVHNQTKSRISAITSPRDDEIRERRRRRRPRSQGDRTTAQSPRNVYQDESTPTRRRSRRSFPKTDDEEVAPTPPGLAPAPKPSRRRSRRSWPRTSDDDVARAPAAPAIIEAPPTKIFGTRLEAWLSGTPDPFVEGGSRKTKPKDSVSSLDLPRKDENSELTISATPNRNDEPKEKSRRRSSGSGSGSGDSGRDRRRRHRQHSRDFTPETSTVDEAPPTVASTVVSSVTTESSAQPTESEISLTPTPTLKRRGAKRSHHSPTKSRSMSSPLRETMSVDDAHDDVESASVVSSSVDASTIDYESVSLRPKPLSIQRGLPPRSKKLSTIISAESSANKTYLTPSEVTGSDYLQTVHEDSVISGVTASEVGSLLNPETSTIVSRRSTRRRKLASHADLISVLSMPKAAGTKSIVSARSIRTNRSRLATATIDDIMRELASDEAKYMRELRTLVDGVIPVLLSCVLSKSDSAVAAGLFSRSAPADPSEVTKPIVNMGVCLERLKTLHKRVPHESSDAFVSWAQSAQRVYADYIAAWRLGFQDVVISLAPADEDPFKPAKVVNGPDDGAPWDEGMPRNAEGYVVNGDGERVDVAYMLKRPLVRLKYLAKTLRGVNHVKPSQNAEKMSSTFQDLVAAARKRSNDEQARLEDEAAASIDATRSRDPRSLAPLAGVRIDSKRCVRARDHFDLHLYHSSGQEVNCRVEILLRDNLPGTGAGGDVLICEVDPTGRWLLLPPIPLSHCSARNGDARGEIIVMIRGNQADGSEWTEVMSLVTDDEQAGFDWVQMLGLHPIPPQISEVRKTAITIEVTPRAASSHESASLLSTVTESTIPQKSRTPSPHEIEIPIGEQHTEVSKVWHYDTSDRRRLSRAISPITPPSEDYANVAMGYDESDMPQPTRSAVSEGDRPASPEEDSKTLRSLDEAVQMAGTGSPTGLKRTRATKRISKDAGLNASRPSRQITLEDPVEPAAISAIAEEPEQPRRRSTKRRPHSLPSTVSSVSQSSKSYSVWMPSSDVDNSDESDDDDRTIEADDLSPPGSPPSPQRPQAHRRVSSVPSLELPSIPRQRKTSVPSTPIRGPREEPKKRRNLPASVLSNSDIEVAEEEADINLEERAPAPPTPPHRSPSPATPATLKGFAIPVLTPSLPGWKNKRRSSSPLKHEYEPSTCTEESISSSSSESEGEEEDVVSGEELSEEDQDSLTSDSSEDELDDDVPMPLMPIGYLGPRGFPSRQLPPAKPIKQPTTTTITTENPEVETKPFPKVSPPASLYTLPNGTITPSQSASNTPYRAVPQGVATASKTIASIFAWSDAGRWDSLHPNECSIVVTPGKIEIFEIDAHHSEPFLADGDEIIQTEGRAPLIAVELTPLVPLRKSTAIDISIRSPPTGDSRIKTGNNIMLRSRSPAECAQLYAMINQSRINNPTYLALQNARGPYGQSSWADVMDRQNAARTNGVSSGLLGGTLGRRSSYRKSSTRAASISAATESSVGTMNSALRSALSRFSFGKHGIFSVRDSTLGSRSSGSFDSGSRPDSGASTPTGDVRRAPGAPAGIVNTKCRLYERESMKKWRDMGSTRLTIMLPSPNASAPSSPTNPHQRAPGVRDHTQERRIIITSKSKGTVLLDVTLSETCFERVARSGIAVSVWEDHVDATGQIGGVAHTGGVLGARARVFMVQMKSERECAYCFSLLGKLRY